MFYKTQVFAEPANKNKKWIIWLPKFNSGVINLLNSVIRTFMVGHLIGHVFQEGHRKVLRVGYPLITFTAGTDFLRKLWKNRIWMLDVRSYEVQVKWCLIILQKKTFFLSKKETFFCQKKINQKILIHIFLCRLFCDILGTVCLPWAIVSNSCRKTGGHTVSSSPKYKQNKITR